MQAGARRQPPNPMPAQHLRKPGNEQELELPPRFLAPDYMGSGKLKGMAAIVTGGDSGIGRAVAVLFAREGADVAIVYLDEHEDAEENKRLVRRRRRASSSPGDVKDPEILRGRGQEDSQDVRPARHPGQQRRLPTAHRKAGGNHRRALQQTLQTNIDGYFHMARAALPHLPAGASHHQYRFGNRDASAASSCWTIRPPRARSMRSPSRWPATCWTAASASMRSRRARCGRRSILPIKRPRTSPSSARTATWGGPRNRRKSRRPTCSSLRPCARYVNGVVLPVMGGPRG